MKVNQFVAIATLAAGVLVAGQASAAVTVWNPSNPVSQYWTAGDGLITSTGALNDSLSFTVGAGQAGALFANIYGNTQGTVSGLTALLDGVSFGSAANGSVRFDFSTGALAAGSHVLSLTGDVAALGYSTNYYGDYHVSIQPVPEPETIVMLLAGLGVIGAITRRRNGKALTA